MNFILHPQLAKDTIPVGDLPLCRVLLMNNHHFPWLVLVPRREDLKEIFDLKPDDYQAVMEEVRKAIKQFAALTKAHKMNIAALGNMVPQLHIHIIARQPDDKAWPQPVWSASVKAEPYQGDTRHLFVNKIKKCLEMA